MFKKFNSYTLDLFTTLLFIIIIYACFLNESYILASWFIILKLFNSEIFIKNFHSQLTPLLSKVCEFYNYLVINNYFKIVLLTLLFSVLIMFNLRGLLIFSILISYPIVYFKKLDTLNYPATEIVKFTLSHVPGEAGGLLAAVFFVGGCGYFYNQHKLHKLEEARLKTEILRKNAEMYCKLNLNSAECKASTFLLQQFTNASFDLTGNKFPFKLKEPTIGDIIVDKDTYNLSDEQAKILQEIKVGVIDTDLSRITEIMSALSL
uniref:hypothetical protein n=1 Tax=Conidiobolus mycophagus TaxID=1368622 RepID=UPI001D0F84F5|nr:hypothetical protein LKZ63_mgp04 [Conidiobolus mycophagus]QZZ81339.1 hypothetical protein [Conidiobolus mycophagus]